MIPLLGVRNLIDSLLARLQKDWRSKVYAFFQTQVKISYVDGRKCHEFTCNAKNCKAKGSLNNWSKQGLVKNEDLQEVATLPEVDGKEGEQQGDSVL